MNQRIIVLDFETFYDKDYTLRKLSYPEYILDPRFQVHGLAVDDGTGQAFYKPEDIPRLLKKLKNDVIVVHNAFFDAAILRWKYNFRPQVIVDTLGLANHVFGSSREQGGQRNDLDGLAIKLGFEPKNRAIDFIGMKSFTDDEWIALSIYAKHDASLTRRIFDALVERVSNPQFEFWLLNHTIDIYTGKTLGIDARKLKSVIEKVETRRTEIVKASGVAPEVLRSNQQFAEELKRRLREAKIKLPMKYRAPTKTEVKKALAKGEKVADKVAVPALSKMDPQFMELLEAGEGPVYDLIRARLVERSATNAVARIRTMLTYDKLGIGIPVHLVYYGAHTGRFAGGGGFNFQNLTSPDRTSDPLDKEIAQLIREAIVPGKGQVFVADDAAQIEARVLAWLAGEQPLLDQFATGADVYSGFISGAIGEDIHKPGAADPKETHGHLKLMRQVGKVAVLGLGYSMGVDKFMVTMQKDGSLRPQVGKGRKFDAKFSAGIVDAYRKQNPNIVQFWEDLNTAFMLAIKGRATSVGFLQFQREGRQDVSIALPSGRKLYYRMLRQVKKTGTQNYTGVDGKHHSKERTGYEWVHGNGQRIYGGLLAENTTQAVARDILVEAIYAAEEAGYPVVLHVHDEIVCRVPQAVGEATLAFLDKALSTAPEWGAGLVLAAEGRIANHLGK